MFGMDSFLESLYIGRDWNCGFFEGFEILHLFYSLLFSRLADNHGSQNPSTNPLTSLPPCTIPSNQKGSYSDSINHGYHSSICTFTYDSEIREYKESVELSTKNKTEPSDFECLRKKNEP